MAGRSLKVEIIGDGRSYERALASAQGSTSKFGTALGVLSKASLLAGGAVAAGFALSVKGAASFQSQLNTFKAVSQATTKQMKAVGDEAKQLGADTTLPATSAQDAAAAMIELSKAGLSVKNTMAAAKGVLQLSAAAQISNADAATITANAMNAYGLAGTQASHVADLLAASSIAASGEMTDMADALKYVSSTAAQAGISIEDTVAAVSLMANKGIIGGQAGAALQQMLLRLETPTTKASAALKDLGVQVYDSGGKMNSVRNLIAQFSGATKGMSDANRNAALNSIFGSRAIRAANIVLDGGTKAFDKMRTAVDRSGAASDLANAKMKGFSGALQGLESAAETLEITIGTPFLGALTAMAHGLAGAVNWVDTLAGKMGNVHGFAAKFTVAFDGAEGAVTDLFNTMKTTLLGSTQPRIMLDTGKVIGFEHVDGLLDKVNWGAVGQTIMDGLVSGIKGTAALGQKLAGIVSDATQGIDWAGLGIKMGPALAGAVVAAFATLMDPSFWAKHWQLAIAVGTVAFGGALGKIGGKLAAPLVKVFGDAFDAMALSVAGFFERWSPKLGALVLRAFAGLPGVIGEALGKLAGVVSGAFGRLGGLARFTIKVLGVEAAISAIGSFVSSATLKFVQFLLWTTTLPSKIMGVFSGAAGWLEGAGEAIMQGLWDGLKKKWHDVEGWLGTVTSLIPIKKGPPAYDKVMLVPAGLAIMGGLQDGMVKGWQPVEAFLVSRASLIERVVGDGALGVAAGIASVAPAVASATLKLTTAATPSQNVLQQAESQYKLLAKYASDFAFKQSSAAAAAGRKLEFYPKGESDSFDPGKVGVEVFGNMAKAIDIAGDLTSHYLAKGVDPIITMYYKQFVSSMTAKQKDMLAQQYAWAQKYEGETRSFMDWKGADGLPAWFRGYAFQQWPDPMKIYTKGQIDQFNKMLAYLKTGGASASSALASSLGAATTIVARLTAQMKAAQERSQDQENQQALQSAEAALAAAKKKGQGVEAAQQQVNAAEDQIRQTAMQRELDDATTLQTQLQTKFDAAQTKLKAAQDKAATAHQAWLDKLKTQTANARQAMGTQFDALASQVDAAFQKIRAAWVAPAQKQLDAISATRAHEDLLNAVTDTGNSLTDAQAQLASMMQADPDNNTAQAIAEQSQAVLEATQAAQRAKDDLTNENLSAQAATQQTAYDNQTDSLQAALDKQLGAMKTQWTKAGVSVSGGMSDIAGIINGFDPDFGKAGDALGSAFSDALMNQLRAAAAAAARITVSVGGSGGGLLGNILNVPDGPSGGGLFGNILGGVPQFGSGGPTGVGGLAVLHPGEFVVPQGGALVSGGSSGRGSSTVNVAAVNVAGYIGNDQDLSRRIRDALLQIRRDEPDILGGRG